jgi:hypothetical protein
MGKEAGNTTSKVHLGIVDLEDLENNIISNLNAMIPLTTICIDKMMEAKRLRMENIPIVNLIAQIALDNKLTKKIAGEIYNDYNVEKDILGNEARSAYGLAAALTRTGQKLDNENWVSFDMLGGFFCEMDENHWKAFNSRAYNLSQKQVEKYFSVSM